MMIYLLVGLLILVLMPVCLYVSIKLGTFAFYRGRELYEDHKKSQSTHFFL